jgi:hypothetical protein
MKKGRTFHHKRNSNYGPSNAGELSRDSEAETTMAAGHIARLNAPRHLEA